MAGNHPRNTIREAIENTLVSANFIDSSKIITGGMYSTLKAKLPNILVYLADENITNLYNNQPMNRYGRALNVYIVISTNNTDRVSAIIENEDLARSCEEALLKPDSDVISPLITYINLAGYEVSEPREGSPVFKTQLIFTVNYNDKF